MAVLVDPPRWPAHGTLFGHLVSDRSLNELQAFARAAGLPPRAFDHDHYDVPVERYPELIAQGALQVSSTELLRRLVAGGLRVRPADRTPRRPDARAGLADRWQRLGLTGSETVRDELIGRWSEPHRVYHDVRHLLQCLHALDELTDGHPAPQTVLLAAWFHDAVYAGAPGADERASAALARDLLAPLLPSDEVSEVQRLVLGTIEHDPAPGDAYGQLLSDADLSVLGLIPGRYHVYARDVREEYLRYPDEQFAHGRRLVIDDLLNRDPLFRTERGRELWQARARTNLAEERARLG
ncbi:DUF4031 domain-containing protein [Micropruina sp.]|uniref:DUF4031 domain-containing protein n=1 Tax=Micropruina sp. TaxID=2737536 RepID=UPI0039E5D14A